VDAAARRRETAVAVVLTAGLLAAVLRHPGGAFVGWATCVLTLGVGVRWLRSARPARGRLRVGLRLLGIGLVSWSAGQLMWLLGAARPATAVFNAAAVVMAAGVAWMAATRRLGSIRATLDGLIMATSLCFISWVVILGPLYRASDGGTAAFSAAAFPLADVLIGSITLLMLYETRGPRRRSVAVAAVGLLFVFAADAAYAAQVFAGTYRAGGVIDLGWFLGFAIVGVGAPRAAEVDGSDAVAEVRAWDHLPYVPFGAALGTAVAAYFVQGGRVDGVLFLLMIAMTVLILVRQLLALRDNRLLNQRLAEVVEDLRHRAYHDPLTGLPNRALLLDTLERRLEAGRPVALLYVDLDGFKPVNDTHGHEAGDRVLSTIAERLAGCAGPADLVARLGGDEFALLVPPGAADRVAARVIAAVGVPVPVRGATVTVGASVGVARHPAGAGSGVGSGAGDLMRHADLAMYAAKLRGRNRAVTFTAELEPASPVAA
jgi:diguanylate cyclase